MGILFFMKFLPVSGKIIFKENVRMKFQFLKKLVLIGVAFMFLPSAGFGLELGPVVDKCLRIIVDKPSGEITEDDLQSIEEFYCYSDEVTVESLKSLAKHLKDRTRISVGLDESDRYLEVCLAEQL